MKKTIKIRAYVAANLGDDLFLEIICNRYSNNIFYLCGSKKFKKVYSKIPNLKYRCWDTTFIRIFCIFYRMIAKVFNYICKKKVVRIIATDDIVNSIYSKKSDYNVYVTGSGFMNLPEELETLPEKYEIEKIYYKRHPFIIGCNFGPFAHEEYLMMYKKLFSYASDLCFRDSYSLELFSKTSVARKAADIVFAYPIKTVKNQHRMIDKEYMLISIANLQKDNDSASDFQQEYINFIKDIVVNRTKEKKYTVLIGFSREQNDHNIILNILENMNDKKYNYMFCYPDISSIEAVSLFRDAKYVIATRYHAMILALIFKKPVCSICYNEKMKHVLEDIDKQAPSVSLEEIRELDYNKLIESKMYCINDQRLKELVSSSNMQFRELDRVLWKR